MTLSASYPSQSDPFSGSESVAMKQTKSSVLTEAGSKSAERMIMNTSIISNKYVVLLQKPTKKVGISLT